jgi:SAM-dependent methyltransferase
MDTVQESIYDNPKYYDLVFGADCASELKFIEACNQRMMGGRAKRMFEPACGTGRLMIKLAKQGYEVGGLDLNPLAIDFCNARLVKHGFKPSAFVGDMSDFQVKKKFDIGFNTINSFRHLSSESAAKKHFQAMASAVRVGGLYLLGLHVRPTEANPSETESWSARRGNLAVNTHMWTLERDIPGRVERFGIRFDVYTPLKQFRIDDVLVLRSYTDRELRKTIRNAGGWTVEETFDFGYEIDLPIEVDGACEDVIYVLRRT